PVAGMVRGAPAAARAGSPTEIGDAFLRANRDRYQVLLTISRLVIVLLSVFSGWLAARWALEWFGDKAACLTALLWATEPTLLANAGLVTTDLGAAAAFVMVLYATWRFAEVPTF